MQLSTKGENVDNQPLVYITWLVWNKQTIWHLRQVNTTHGKPVQSKWDYESQTMRTRDTQQQGCNLSWQIWQCWGWGGERERKKETVITQHPYTESARFPNQGMCLASEPHPQPLHLYWYLSTLEVSWWGSAIDHPAWGIINRTKMPNCTCCLTHNITIRARWCQGFILNKLNQKFC